jgi:hypothetical protein
VSPSAGREGEVILILQRVQNDFYVRYGYT